MQVLSKFYKTEVQAFNLLLLEVHLPELSVVCRDLLYLLFLLNTIKICFM